MAAKFAALDDANATQYPHPILAGGMRLTAKNTIVDRNVPAIENAMPGVCMCDENNSLG